MSNPTTTTNNSTDYLTIQNTTSTTPIYLTKYFITDIPASVNIHTNEAVYSKLMFVPHPYTTADAESWITSQLLPVPIPAILPYQVIRANHPDQNGLFIGGASLCLKEDGSGEHELGYYLHPDWRGKGIMRAAVRELVEWATKEQGAKAIVRVAEGNLESRRVIEGMPEWERVESRDGDVDVPEVKGGGKRHVLFWKWTG